MAPHPVTPSRVRPRRRAAQAPARAALLWLDEGRQDLVVSLRSSCGAAEAQPLRLRLGLAPADRASAAHVSRGARQWGERDQAAAVPACMRRVRMQHACNPTLAAAPGVFAGRAGVHDHAGGPRGARAGAGADAPRAAMLGARLRRCARRACMRNVPGCLQAGRRCRVLKPACRCRAADAARRCLWLTSDGAWLVRPHDGGDAASIGLERTDGRVRGVVALDVCHGALLLRPLHGCGVRCGAARRGMLATGPCCGACPHSTCSPQLSRLTCPPAPRRSAAPEPVRSLDDALRVLGRAAAAKQQLDRGIAAALAGLQQQPAAGGALRKALAMADADALAAGTGGSAAAM